MRKVAVLLILVGLVALTSGCERQTTRPGITKTPPAQTVPKK